MIFEGVDERQIALAIQRAVSVSETYDFQYICAINSDTIPWDEFSAGFDFRSYDRLTLTDESTEGGLLGIRF